MAGKKLKYFLDHPQIKRNKSPGNGKSPSKMGQDSSSRAMGPGDPSTSAAKKAASEALVPSKKANKLSNTADAIEKHLKGKN